MITRISAAALGVAATLTASPVLAQMQGMDHSQHDAAPPMAAPAPQADPHAGHDMSQMGGMDMMPGGDEAARSSGTSRLPAAEGPMRGLHWMPGDWMVMVHGYAWGVYSDQGGPRGGSQAFVASMAMVQASRDVSSKTRIQFRTMLSAEPLMSARGYPNLFATGETAGGLPLVDRQHPHDLFMELSARIDTDLGADTTAFLYGGPVGEPALGPSAFMHRRSARLNPEAPISHHWLDSTHITYGVVTAGLSGKRWQVEASAFRGREPDESRWDIETPKLDSWSVRATWMPSPNWAVSLSHGFLKDAEATHPGENERRTIGAVHYADQRLAVTAAYSHKVHNGDAHGGFLAEANWDITPRHAVFGRVETVENEELFEAPDPLAGRSFTVTKATLGYGYTIPFGLMSLTLGGSASLYAKPSALDVAYSSNPKSFTLFAKLALGS
ncbi:MAG: hypothetical protein ABI898_00590 [Sphingomonadales bacterium]